MLPWVTDSGIFGDTKASIIDVTLPPGGCLLIPTTRVTGVRRIGTTSSFQLQLCLSSACLLSVPKSGQCPTSSSSWRIDQSSLPLVDRSSLCHYSQESGYKIYFKHPYKAFTGANKALLTSCRICHRWPLTSADSIRASARTDAFLQSFFSLCPLFPVLRSLSDFQMPSRVLRSLPMRSMTT